jgi:gliding motility-associated-like protein
MRILFITFLLSIACLNCYCQCSVQVGLPPADSYFNSASDGSASTVQGGQPDRHWKVAKDSINGDYQPAVALSVFPSVFYSSERRDCSWISFSPTGEHSGNRFFFFKIDFDLPCFSSCGKSYDKANTFCVNLDLYADNSIYEIYVNGIAQSAKLGNGIPVANAYQAEGARAGHKIFASLCQDWKAGTNSLIIKIASSATVAALLVEAAITPLPPIEQKTTTTICEGTSYHHGNRDLTKAGYYLDTFHTSTGCDSVVALELAVKSRASSATSQTICEGQSYNGHTKSGQYTDTFKAANGCDSLCSVTLTVQKKPAPSLGSSQQLCTGDSLLLSPGVFNSYAWQDGSTKPGFLVTAPGAYAVTVTNNCGAGSTEILITEKTCGAYFPSAFTPNKDGRNDLFRILGANGFNEYELVIYNRWGQKIFETRDSTKGWDGNVQGQMQRQDTFVWTCNYKKNNIATSLKGTVLLIR